MAGGGGGHNNEQEPASTFLPEMLRGHIITQKAQNCRTLPSPTLPSTSSKLRFSKHSKINRQSTGMNTELLLSGSGTWESFMIINVKLAFDILEYQQPVIDNATAQNEGSHTS